MKNISTETLQSLDRFRNKVPPIPEPGQKHRSGIVVGSGPAKLSLTGVPTPFLVGDILLFSEGSEEGSQIRFWDFGRDRERGVPVDGKLVDTGRGISWDSEDRVALLAPVESEDYEIWFSSLKKEPSLEELDDIIWSLADEEVAQEESKIADLPPIQEEWIYLQEDGQGKVVLIAEYNDRAFSVVGKPGTEYDKEAKLTRETYEGFPPADAWRRYARPHDMGAGNLRGTVLKATPENKAKIDEALAQWRADG
jgi:hypothetical protein